MKLLDLCINLRCSKARLSARFKSRWPQAVRAENGESSMDGSSEIEAKAGAARDSHDPGEIHQTSPGSTPAVPAADSSGQPRILVIDDERSMRRVCSIALRGEGWLAEGEESPVRALERLRAGEHFDVLVLDYSMDELNGVDFLRELDASPGLVRPPVVMASAHADGSVAMEALKLGVWDFLAKPLTPEDLRRAVQRLLERPEAAARGDARAQLLLALTGGNLNEVETTLPVAGTETDLLLQGLFKQVQGDAGGAELCFADAHWWTGWVDQGPEIWTELIRRLDA